MRPGSISPQEVEAQNRRFRTWFQRYILFWVLVITIVVIFSDYSVLSSEPAYWHDWRAPVVILGSVALFGFYISPFLLGRWLGWEEPVPLRYGLPIWLTMYGLLLLLSLLNNGFSWDYWVLFGFSFAVFRGFYLIPAIVIAIVTLYAFNWSWPLQDIDIGAIVGTTIGIVSSLAAAFIIYQLISERFERGELLQKLSEAHAELEEAHRRLEESAAQEQELAVLRERARLAREMHDTLGHALVLISVKLEAAQRLRPRDPERCDRELEATKEVVRETMNELRASIANLRSPALEREPVSQALARHAREMARRAGLRLTCALDPTLDGLPAEVEETLWKIGQEALTNIEKHAHASSVLLRMGRQDGRVLLRIEDDGVGLPTDVCTPTGDDGRLSCASPQGHFGLSGMYERAKNAGGELAIYRGAERGTRIELSLPLIETPS